MVAVRNNKSAAYRRFIRRALERYWTDALSRLRRARRHNNTLYAFFMASAELRTLTLALHATPAHTAHLSLTGGGMLNAGYSFALGLSNSIAIVCFTARASCTRPRDVAAGRTLPALRRATPRHPAPPARRAAVPRAPVTSRPER